MELGRERPEPVAAGGEDEVVDADPPQVRGDRVPVGRRGAGEPVPEAPRRRVDANLAAGLGVDQGELAEVRQLAFTRIADLDREDVMSRGERREGSLPIARTAKVGDEDDEPAGGAVASGAREPQRSRGARYPMC